jgi:hypothetical protein
LALCDGFIWYRESRYQCEWSNSIQRVDLTLNNLQELVNISISLFYIPFFFFLEVLGLQMQAVKSLIKFIERGALEIPHRIDDL